MAVPVHVYSAHFDTAEDARQFATESYTDEGNVIRAPLWRAIGARRLDHDFVETNFGPDLYSRIGYLFVGVPELEAMVRELQPRHNTLFLVFASGSNASFVPRPTTNPQFVGTFQATFP